MKETHETESRTNRIRRILPILFVMEPGRQDRRQWLQAMRALEYFSLRGRQIQTKGKKFVAEPVA
jgi:hypothetical protein